MAEQTNPLRGVGLLDYKDLSEYHNSYGYHSDAEFAGPFISVGIDACQMQIKASYNFNFVKMRVLNPMTGIWSDWKNINLT